MNRIGFACSALAVLLGVVVAMPAAAEVLDAVYRGTLVCDRLPFTDAKMREAIAVTIAGGGRRAGAGHRHAERSGHRPARRLAGG
jgi:hypothetical protein